MRKKGGETSSRQFLKTLSRPEPFHSVSSKTPYQSMQLKSTSEFEYGKIDLFSNNVDLSDFILSILSNILGDLSEKLLPQRTRSLPNKSLVKSMVKNRHNVSLGGTSENSNIIQYNEKKENIYLILDNFHDFAFKNDADKFFNFDEIKNKFKSDILGSLHTFENKMFLRKLSEYRQSNPLNCIIGENSFICPGSIILGSCQIGKNTIVGSKNIILPKTKILNNTFIKAKI